MVKFHGPSLSLNKHNYSDQTRRVEQSARDYPTDPRAEQCQQAERDFVDASPQGQGYRLVAGRPRLANLRGAPAVEEVCNR